MKKLLILLIAIFSVVSTVSANTLVYHCVSLQGKKRSATGTWINDGAAISRMNDPITVFISNTKIEIQDKGGTTFHIGRAIDSYTGTETEQVVYQAVDDEGVKCTITIVTGNSTNGSSFVLLIAEYSNYKFQYGMNPAD